MTREEVENRITEKFIEIIDTVKEYEPKTTYITLSFVNGNILGFNDFFYTEEGVFTEKSGFGKIDFWKELPKK